MEFKILANKFGSIHFENFTDKSSQIASLNRNRSGSIKKSLKGWMLFIVNNKKSFMKPECSVTQSSAMTHPQKWTINSLHVIRESYI